MALALAMLLALVVAGLLEPDPRGHGTHQQLGLPPCTFFLLFGQRCPTCGMTTAWAHLAKGRLEAAAKAHVTGTVLAVLDLVGALWLLSVAWRGRWLGAVPDSNAGAWLAAALAVAMLIEWGLRLLAG